MLFRSRWRGAAPVERALLAGDAMTGVCLMRLDAGLDTGPVYDRVEVAVGPDDTAGALRARLAEAGARLLVECLPSIPARVPEPQVGEATHAAKLTVEEFRIDPTRDDAATILRRVRAGTPRPGAWMTVAGERLKVLRADLAPSGAPPVGVIDGAGVLGTRSGGVELLEVRPEGRRAMSGRAFVAGQIGRAHV